MECGSTVPFIFSSLEELNNHLAKCERADKISIPALELLKKRSICLEQFIFVMGPAIKSYSDLNSQNLLLLAKSIQRLFPKDEQSETDKIALSTFWKVVKESQKRDVIYKSSLELPPALVGVGEREELREDLSEKCLMDAKEIMSLSTKERLDLALSLYSHPAVDVLEEAKRFQSILSCLYMEDLSFRQLSVDVHLALEIDRFQRLYREGCQQIIQTSPFFEATFFEFPEEIKNSDEFAFWLKVSPFIEIYEHGGKNQFMIKPCPKSESLSSLQANANYYLAKAQSEKFKFIVQKIIFALEKEKVLFRYAKELKKRTNPLINRIVEWAFIHDVTSEKFVTPLFYFILKLVGDERKQAIEVSLKPFDLDLPRDLNMRDYQLRQKIIEIWVKERNNQKFFFDSVLASLKDLVRQVSPHSSIKKALFECQKNTFEGSGNLSSDFYRLPISLPTLENSSSTPSSQASFDWIPSTQKNLGKAKKLPYRCPKQSFKGKSKKSKKSEAKEKEKERENPPLKGVSSRPPNSPIHSIPTKLRTIESSRPFPYKYALRVERWRQYEIGKSLPQEDFPEYADKSLEYQELTHIFHFLSPLVDQLFEDWAIRSQRKNATTGEMDYWDIIPAEIKFKGEVYRGVITYATNKQKICYHRCFTKYVETEIITNIIKKTFDKFDFPDLQTFGQILSQSKKRKPIVVSNEQIQIDSILGTAEIINFNSNYQIKLFKSTI